MEITSDCVWINIFAVFATCLIVIFTYIQWSFKYWERKKVPYIKPEIPFGTMGKFLRASESFGELLKNQYEQSKQKAYKHIGLFIFTGPTYMPIATEYIKDILSKQSHCFIDRGFYCNEKDDPLTGHLFSLQGEKWRKLRMKLTPTFTSAKIKTMFHILVECGNQLTDAMNSICEKNEAVDIKKVISNFGVDVIGSCAFGIDCNSFKNPDSDLQKYARRFIVPSNYECIKGFLAATNQSLAKSLGVVVTPNDISTFFLNTMRRTVEQRVNSKITPNDFLQILMDLKNNVGDTHEQYFSIEQLTAQAVIFFVAGFESSSTTMSFCLHELAQNPQIQERARDEINSVLDKYYGEVSYESLKEMKYMKHVIDETLRKYPPVPMLNRKCVMDYKVPNSNLTIDKGTAVVISLYGLHNDPEYFPHPETFDPERFNADNKKHIKPFTYMPFGEGPRLCIGLRFGLMQVGVGLTFLLKNFRFSLSEKTTLPLQLDPAGFTLSVLGGLWLNAEKI